MKKLIWKVEIQHKFMKLLFKKASRFLTSALMTRKKNNCFDYCIEIECNNLKITKYTIQEFLCCKNQQITVQKNLRSISFEQTYDLIFRRCMAQNNWRTWHRYLNKYIISLFYHCTKQKFVKHTFKHHSISFLNYSSSYNFEQHIYKTIKNKCSQSFITPSKTRVTNQEKKREKKREKNYQQNLQSIIQTWPRVAIDIRSLVTKTMHISQLLRCPHCHLQQSCRQGTRGSEDERIGRVNRLSSLGNGRYRSIMPF